MSGMMNKKQIQILKMIQPCWRLKSILLILFCSWEKHFMILYSAWQSWQESQNYSHILKIKE